MVSTEIGEDAKQSDRAPAVLQDGSIDKAHLAMGGCLALGRFAHDMGVPMDRRPSGLSHAQGGWLAL